MFYQTALMSESLITHFPRTRVLTNIYGLMKFKIALLNTLHIYTVAHQYVCVDDLSNCSTD